MYDENPGEIDFGSSQRGFELWAVDCIQNTMFKMSSVVLLFYIFTFICFNITYILYLEE